MISHAVLLLPVPTQPNNLTSGLLVALIPNITTGDGVGGAHHSSLSNSLLPVSLWTSVCQDDLYLTHLLSLFWTWDNTLSQIVDRSVFLEELRSGCVDESHFCSGFLVNSLLAVSWIYFRHGGDVATPSTPRGRHFAYEALQQLEAQKSRLSLTLLQGLAMLAVFEAASGNHSRSTALLDQLCSVHDEIRLHEVDAFIQRFLLGVSVGKSRRTVSVVAWGFYSLSTKFRLCFGRPVPMHKPRMRSSSELESYEPDTSESLWTPYPNTSQMRLSYSKLSFSAGCRLTELSERVLLSATRQSGDEKAIVPDLEELHALYLELMRWKAAAPDMHSASFCNLPAFVNLFVTFDMILLRLLEPLSQQPFPGPGHPSGSFSAALRGTSLMSTIWSYRSAYGLRNDYWLIQACFTAATSMLPSVEPGSVFADAFTKACQVLFEAGEHLPLANQLLLGLKGLIAQHKIEISASTRKLFSAVAARSGYIRLKDVRLALSADELEVASISGIDSISAHDVIFSDMIGDITRID